MKKRISTYILILFIFSSLSCKSQENKKSEIIQKPKSFKIIEEIEGDLDKDGISEKVIVYDTEKEIDLGTERQIYIYKKKKSKHGRFDMRKQDNMPARNKKNFRSTKSGAGMTAKGVAAYRRKNPGSKLKTAVTGKVKPGSKDANRRKSYCARSAGQMKKFPKAAKDPNSRLRQARKRWKC